MKFMVGQHDGARSVFVVDGNGARNLTRAAPEIGTDLLRLAKGMLSAEEVAARIAELPNIALADIQVLLPIARPSKIICLGLNYVDHVKEGGYEIPDYPALFMRGGNSIMPAGAPMVRPACSERLDYEAELMVIVGTGGRHIAEADALSHVFGYTAFNDGSVRDYQRKTHQWTPGKNFDATGAIGPLVVTPDELPLGAAGLKIESRVGSEILQSANTSDMMWSVAKAIATISEYATLEPGDLIAMGTPPGVGHARTPPRWLRPGEVIDVEIEGIGICSSPIVAEEDMFAKAAE
ncbi:fumarylacetoacetate hydrolase family protein [Sphingomonas sp.]|jgi:2-keto-4-pentenoate hydratase/2-oxohepta-3-ene-1,7-dioic acid hydratase in catechol pathway|uniref:fumarylacetoacetate hydrolase family protein n=1 Tax=Sphingomonas sp. TaxID=28214 RepID=UPI002EDAF6CC